MVYKEARTNTSPSSLCSYTAEDAGGTTIVASTSFSLSSTILNNGFIFTAGSSGFQLLLKRFYAIFLVRPYRFLYPLPSAIFFRFTIGIRLGKVRFHDDDGRGESKCCFLEIDFQNSFYLVQIIFLGGNLLGGEVSGIQAHPWPPCVSPMNIMIMLYTSCPSDKLFIWFSSSYNVRSLNLDLWCKQTSGDAFHFSMCIMEKGKETRQIMSIFCFFIFSFLKTFFPSCVSTLLY